MAKSVGKRKRASTSKSIEGMAAAVETERQLEDRLAAARKEHARRMDKLASAKEAKDRQKVAKRRRQVDEAMKEVAAISDRLAQLAGSVAATPTIAPPDAPDAASAADATDAVKRPARSARPRVASTGTSAQAAEPGPDPSHKPGPDEAG